MEYRYISSSQERGVIAEEIISIRDKRFATKLASIEPLVVQFLSLFQSDFYPYVSNRRILCRSTTLYELLAECTRCKSIVTIWKEMRDWFVRSEGKYDPSTLRRKAIDKLDSLDYRSMIIEWSLENEWGNWDNRKPLTVGPICVLIVNSDAFVECIRRYLLDAGNKLQEWDEYYQKIGRITQSLDSELRRIELLYSFILKYYVCAGKLDFLDVANRFSTFCSAYLQIVLPNMQLNKNLDQIRQSADCLANENPILKDPLLYFTNDGVRSAQDPNVARRHYFANREEAQLRAARALQQCYNRACENLLLTEEQEDALKKLNILFPDNPESKIDLGYNVRSYRYLSGVEEIFSELDVLVRGNSDDCYSFSNYLEATCLSFWNLAKFELPLRICAHCNRFFISKQNRSSQRVYCQRKSPENSDWVCSQYHSHFVSRYKGSENFKKFDDKIGALRSKISRGNKAGGCAGVPLNPLNKSDKKKADALLPVTTFTLIALRVIRENARNDTADLNLALNCALVQALTKIYDYVGSNPTSIIPTKRIPHDLNSFSETYEDCFAIIKVSYEDMIEGK